MSMIKPDATFCRQPFVPHWEAGSVLSESESEKNYLGQFIPLHYHHNMLMDQKRMAGFRAAIDRVVFDGAKVVELGGGTGVLSCFAAARAARVWCVEFNPDMVAESRRLLALNPDGHKVEVVHADAFHFLPPEPVDVVICEMIHVAMLREKQVDVIEAFKERYRRRFGERLPIFVPEAIVMAVQPLQQVYDFHGFHAPIVQFQRPDAIHAGTREMAPPQLYSLLDFQQSVGREIRWQGSFVITGDGRVNALRFVTRNILAVVEEAGTSIDWLNDYLVLPLAEPVAVCAGDQLRVKFAYFTGGSLDSLSRNMRVSVQSARRSRLA